MSEDSTGRHVGPELTDEQCMLAFCSGDPRGFELLVRRYRTPVFHFVLRQCGDPARAEDLLQETWLRVVRGSQGWQPKAKFRTWLYTLARNLCVDHARQDTSRKEDSLEVPGRLGEGRASLAERLSDENAAPDRRAHQRELRPLLEQALAQLPPEQREVFWLREYAGLPFKDIAEVTGVPENTVKSRMRYALEGLRRRLLALGVDSEGWGEGRTVTG